ncbi:hypothetical protein KIN20_031050 [Parelaphostrongylus tenuis]|uniref:PiggyBac transposable element-derived protein domain-containing protein n=1 Tax=Parelaphostrongylus tenuis TaxID=148309 RepID=A0AAD5WGY2_PARTN|nr:hypothetical protein KIN20_031046 [Parelaphostrongylus tenuis]KAJ1369564.1 hypothetical protein KIN20_031050 [Parelaphostrongylus tenuis]
MAKRKIHRLMQEHSGWSWSVVSPMSKLFNRDHVGVQNLALLGRKSLVEHYELFMKDVWEMTVEQTNIYGHQKKEGWKDTTIEEMKIFLDLCLKMTFTQLPNHLRLLDQ